MLSLKIRVHPGIWLGSLALLMLQLSCQSGQPTSSQEARPDTTASHDSAQQPGTDAVTVSLTPAQYREAGITLGQLSHRPLQRILNVNGVMDVPAQNQVSVSVPMGGYIRQIRLEPGMAIRRGQPLVVLENPDYIQLQQDYLDTKAKLTYADLDFARQQELSQENVAALKVFQQTRANRQSLQAQLAGLGQRLRMLHIDPATLTPDRLTRTITIPAPVSGYVTDVPVNNGRFVNPADVLVQLTDISHLHLRLRVFETDIPRLHVGQSVRFSVGDDTTQRATVFPHRATIFLIGKAIAPDRTVEVLAHPDGPDQFIPGSYLSAQVALQTQELPTLPESAVVRYGGKTYVYQLDSQSGANRPATAYQFRQVAVQTGIRQAGYVAVNLPATYRTSPRPLVLNGAYSLLAKLNNSEEE